MQQKARVVYQNVVKTADQSKIAKTDGTLLVLREARSSLAADILNSILGLPVYDSIYNLTY